MELLSGMVEEVSSGALRVRYDMYASYVLKEVASTKELRAVVDAILEYFSQFSTPIISNIRKLEAQLFKYTLNNNNIHRLFDGRQSRGRSIGIYTDMEQRLQLDGHFWLQYGLLLRRYGRHSDALEKFERSIEAYDNEYAKHARAQQQLIIAANAERSSMEVAKALVLKAEEYLVDRHHNPSWFGRDNDGDYPISVLGHYYIDALVNIGEVDEARIKARTYFNWISEIDRVSSYEVLPGLRERLMKMGATGYWKRNKYTIGETEYRP